MISMNPQSQKLVEGYLERLRQSLSGLPVHERDDAVEEVRTHIEEALTRIGQQDISAVSTVLRNLGEPRDYAASLPGISTTLEQRLERLEKLTGISATQMASGFDPAKFQGILMTYFAWTWIPFLAMFTLMLLNRGLGYDILGTVSGSVLGVPIVVTDGLARFGIIAVGGLAIGALAIGGGALGLIAFGGGALGLVAIGGGAVGLIAIGGGAFGYVAIGGGAYGVYALAGDGKGKHVFDLKRQDDEAVRFFCRYLPRLKQAFAEQGAGAI